MPYGPQLSVSGIECSVCEPATDTAAAAAAGGWCSGGGEVVVITSAPASSSSVGTSSSAASVSAAAIIRSRLSRAASCIMATKEELSWTGTSEGKPNEMSGRLGSSRSICRRLTWSSRESRTGLKGVRLERDGPFSRSETGADDKGNKARGDEGFPSNDAEAAAGAMPVVKKDVLIETLSDMELLLGPWSWKQAWCEHMHQPAWLAFSSARLPLMFPAG